MKQSKKVVARIIILILALFTVIPGTVSQKVYAEPGGSESSQAADASKDDSNKKEEKKEEDMTPEEREKKAEEDAYKMECPICVNTARSTVYETMYKKYDSPDM